VSKEIAEMWADILGYGHEAVEENGAWVVVWSDIHFKTMKPVYYRTPAECFRDAFRQEMERAR